MIVSVYALLSVIIVSLISLLGALFLIFQRRVLEELVTYSLALSSGILLGAAFLDILPESLDHLAPESAFQFVLVGMIAFFALEKLISWHHHHADEEEYIRKEKPVVYLTLVGDGIHNFMDGLVIGIAYLVSIPLGLVTTVAIIGHEIPHELSDFMILIYGGFSNRKALLWNFLSGLTAVFGTILVLLESKFVISQAGFLLPFAAGNFIYIAASDLIPELHKRRQLMVSFLQIILIAVGIAAIYLMKQTLD